MKSAWNHFHFSFQAEDIKNLTICLRLKVFYLRGRLTNFLSFANIDSADALTGAIVKKTFDQPYL